MPIFISAQRSKIFERLGLGSGVMSETYSPFFSEKACINETKASTEALGKAL
jgi:hypothetical protein